MSFNSSHISEINCTAEVCLDENKHTLKANDFVSKLINHAFQTYHFVDLENDKILLSGYHISNFHIFLEGFNIHVQTISINVQSWTKKTRHLMLFQHISS